MAPTLAKTPPTGPEWLHEVKFDGWRAQLHVENGAYTLYSKNGTDYTKRFNGLRDVVSNIRVKSAIIDCELVACDDNGMPCFRTLMQLGNRATLCLVGFDLLHLDGVRLMPIAIEQRKDMLRTLVDLVASRQFQFSDTFNDPIKLLDACSKHGLEGIVSKRKGSAYRSGPTKEWLKVKTAAWRLENRNRWEMFQRR
jgi:ATP-dependent DNA ligase